MIMMEVPYHYQFRVIVIGDTMVGKSSLLKTFSDGTFGEMEPTVGVDFFSKIIEIKPKQQQQYNNIGASTTTDNDPVHLRSNLASNNYHQHNRPQDENIVVKLQIWDTAGQERFKSIVTSYYRNSVGIVLVYDVTNRESYDHLIDWFTEARRHVEPAPTSNNMSPATHNPPSSTKNSSTTNNYPLTSTPNVSPTKRQSNNNNNNNNNYDNISQLSFSGSSSRNNATTPTDTSNISFNSFSERRFRLDYDESDYKMAYLVLGCKTDLECQRQVSYEDGQAFADLYGFKFIETSSKTHYNVNQAFQLLAEEIYDKISECGRLNRLHRTASGGHLTFDGMSSQANEGIRIGPLIENNSRHYSDGNGVCLLEAQPVSGFLGGCC